MGLAVEVRLARAGVAERVYGDGLGDERGRADDR